MRTRGRAPVALAAGLCALLTGTACTSDAPDPEETSAEPLPTSYRGELPPGVRGEPVRHLHGPGSDGPDILDDPAGVRIEAVGDAFLISSNSEERHLLQRADDGATLWEGEQRVDGVDAGRDGSPVVRLSRGTDGDKGDGDADATGRTVVDDAGSKVWSGSDPRERYLDGLVVRRPEKWSPDHPHGDFTVLDTDGDELWDYTFEKPPAKEDEKGEDADPDRKGVPVGARDDVLLLDDGSGLLQGRDLAGGDGDAGELLWSLAGDDADLAGDPAVPRHEPRIVGFYDLPTSGGDTPSTSPRESGEASESPEKEGPTATETVLVRWSSPEDPSILSLLDLRSGELLWTFTEPGANPGEGRFDPEPVSGTVYDGATHTLVLPQATGETPMIGVDMVAGETRWEFDSEEERSISPALAMDGHVYGDSREAGRDTASQVVLDATTKDVLADDLDTYVETATTDGHTLVVQDRQRFVVEETG